MELLMIHGATECAKCKKTRAVLEAVADADVSVREIASDSEEAKRYGAVALPMVLLDGKVICAGMTPLESAVRRLVQQEATTAQS